MTLEVEVYGRNMEVTDRIRDYVRKKVAKLDRHLDDIDEIKVDLEYVKSVRSSTDRHVAQITVHGRGLLLRCEERADDVFAAFDIAMEKMQRQVERYKGKRHRGRGDGRSLAELVVPQEKDDEEKQTVITHRKEFDLIPMNEMDALEQMKLLSHEDFFIFFNVDNNAINVLYRRRDGSYGLILPKVR